MILELRVISWTSWNRFKNKQLFFRQSNASNIVGQINCVGVTALKQQLLLIFMMESYVIVTSNEGLSAYTMQSL